MAKQSGIHQLRGKVGDMSYYRQSGVASGLVRGINPGMSSRVKTSPEYENTRRNNAEFRLATLFAASALKGVIPSFRPMFNLFKNAKLSKGLLEIVKSNTGTWGGRSLTITNRTSICDAINALAKNNFSNYGDVVFGAYDSGGNEQDIDFTPSESMQAILDSIGASGLEVQIQAVNIYEGVPVAGVQTVEPNITKLGELSSDVVASGSVTPLNFHVPALDLDLTILSTARVGLKFYCVVLMPYRTVGTSTYVLQEGCTFAYFADPEQSA